MKTGYRKAIEVLFLEYQRLVSENGNEEDIKSIREGIEYLCYPYRDDLSEDTRSLIQDPESDLYLDKADRSTPEKDKAFWEEMTRASQKHLDIALYALEVLKKL